MSLPTDSICIGFAVGFLVSLNIGECIQSLMAANLQIPNLHSLQLISLVAAVTAMSYCTIGIGGSIKAGKQPDATYNLDGFHLLWDFFGAHCCGIAVRRSFSKD